MIPTDKLGRKARSLFVSHFKREPAVCAYAPGRIEVLGNHTDYNEGFVLSAAIGLGTFFLAAPSATAKCRVVAGDLMEEVSFDTGDPSPSRHDPWANYVKGVFAGIAGHAAIRKGFDALFLGNIPLGAGLSSSAALEISAGLALSAIYKFKPDMITLARIGQKAEHDFAGVKCGLMDQITSLYGKRHSLVLTDFRSLEARTVPLNNASFLLCNTRVKHRLVDGAYNERRRSCEAAAAYLASVLEHPVKALRDATARELSQHSSRMDPIAVKRAAHIIGENDRVLRAARLLIAGKLEDFGKLMYASHESSVRNFENSCEELDAIVNAAKKIPGILGARLSGGGFGGSVVALVHPRDAEVAGKAVASAYSRKYGKPCDVSLVVPSAGAGLVTIRR